jgi:hypothetical protein
VTIAIANGLSVFFHLFYTPPGTLTRLFTVNSKRSTCGSTTNGRLLNAKPFEQV